jgi:oligosaccharyltransferase complex subunit beta
MRSLVSFLLVLAATVQAISSNGGNRLLVVLEDVTEKDGYSKFLGDLEGMCGSSCIHSTSRIC